MKTTPTKEELKKALENLKDNYENIVSLSLGFCRNVSPLPPGIEDEIKENLDNLINNIESEIKQVENEEYFFFYILPRQK